GDFTFLYTVWFYCVHLLNHYAIYVLIEDYLQKEFHLKNGYEDYEGAQYINLLMRQRKKYMECIEEVINIP
ncbi:hypothetical protein QHH03_27795, partial [Aphanizomenon sp. 202]|nr:hypothetical protein [Aphanizomenon sp. 202]